MTSLDVVAKDRGMSARLLFWLEATLLTLVCFSAAGVPRLVPILLDFLAGVAAIHVFTTDRARPFQVSSHRGEHRTPRVRRLCVHQRDMGGRPRRRVGKGGDGARSHCRGGAPRLVLFFAGYRQGASSGEMGARRPRVRSRLLVDRAQLRRNRSRAS
jgi:hypothetical protein